MGDFTLRVGDICAGRSGDKGDMLDLTLVARDAAGYRAIERVLTEDFVRRALNREPSGNARGYGGNLSG